MDTAAKIAILNNKSFPNFDWEYLERMMQHLHSFLLFAFRMEGQGELSFLLLLLLLLLGTFYFLPVFTSLHQQMDLLSYECYLDIKTSRKLNFSKIQKKYKFTFYKEKF